jgi:hypothetical protein
LLVLLPGRGRRWPRQDAGVPAPGRAAAAARRRCRCARAGRVCACAAPPRRPGGCDRVQAAAMASRAARGAGSRGATERRRALLPAPRAARLAIAAACTRSHPPGRRGGAAHAHTQRAARARAAAAAARGARRCGAAAPLPHAAPSPPRPGSPPPASRAPPYAPRAAHLDGLVDIADVLRLNVGVLLPRAHELRERRQKALDADAAHLGVLPGHQGCGAAGAGRRQIITTPGGPPRLQRPHQTRRKHPPLPFLLTMEAARTTIVAAWAGGRVAGARRGWGRVEQGGGVEESIGRGRGRDKARARRTSPVTIGHAVWRAREAQGARRPK